MCREQLITLFCTCLIAYTGSSAQFFGYAGAAIALVFANIGAAYGTAKSSIGIANMGMVDQTKIFRALIPIIFSGILGIYGLIIAVLMSAKVKDADIQNGYKIFSAGICCGMSGLASGLAIGVAGEAGVKAYAQTEHIFVGMILIMIFAEAIGLYGLIIAIIMTTG